MTLLDVKDLSFSYDGSVTVLDSVSFTVPEGTVVGLIGPNGSGKSTLVKNVFDLLQAQQGRITVGGHPHTTTRARAQAIYLASNDYLPQFLTAREYVNTLAAMYDVEVSESDALELLAQFSMEGRYDDLIEDYSHGMRKKTQLISALLLRRPLTVIDETLNGIDIEAMYVAERHLRALRDAGASVLLCTHDFGLLERVADRIVFLDLGQLVVDATTESLVEAHGGLAQLVFGHLEGHLDGGVDADVRRS